MACKAAPPPVVFVLLLVLFSFLSPEEISANGSRLGKSVSSSSSPSSSSSSSSSSTQSLTSAASSSSLTPITSATSPSSSVSGLGSSGASGHGSSASLSSSSASASAAAVKAAAAGGTSATSQARSYAGAMPLAGVAASSRSASQHLQHQHQHQLQQQHHQPSPQYAMHAPAASAGGPTTTVGLTSLSPSAEAGAGIPQLSVADILALRRAVQQSQFVSRSGVLAPSSSGSLGRGNLGYGSSALLGQFGATQFPGGAAVSSQFHDPYLASASAPTATHIAPPNSGNKNSISTRLRSFMNSLFFRRSTAASPAFYQGGPSPYGIPGASGASASPFGVPTGYHHHHHHSPQHVAAAHGFSSKIFSSGPANYGSQSPMSSYPSAGGTVKSSIGSSGLASKPTTYQTSASSLVSTVQKASVLPVPAGSIGSASLPSGLSSLGRPLSPSSSGSAAAFYHASSASPGGGVSSSSMGSPGSASSFDKSQFSSLYGSNGFTAKAGPMVSLQSSAKSSKSLKATSGSTMETVDSQLTGFQPVRAYRPSQPTTALKDVSATNVAYAELSRKAGGSKGQPGVSSEIMSSVQSGHSAASTRLQSSPSSSSSALSRGTTLNDNSQEQSSSSSSSSKS